jgi:hypothetical protein
VAAKKGAINTRYTKELVDKICSRIAGGESLNSICKEKDMPHLVTIFRWLPKYPEFREKYESARRMMADAMFEQMITDIKEIKHGSIEPKAGRVVLDGTKWVLGRLNCPKYGEKRHLSMSGPDNGPIEVRQKLDMDIDALNKIIEESETNNSEE